MKHYSQMNVLECRQIEQKNTDLDRLKEALESLEMVEEACNIHQLWVGNHIEQIRLAVENEKARVEEGETP